MARKNGRSTAHDVAAIESEIAKLMRDLETRVGRLNTLTKRGASHAASEASEYVSEALAETAERLRSTAEEGTNRLRGHAHAFTDDAARFGHQALRRIEDEVEHRPLLTLAVAAGIGFLAGMAGRRQ